MTRFIWCSGSMHIEFFIQPHLASKTLYFCNTILPTYTTIICNIKFGNGCTCMINMAYIHTMEGRDNVYLATRWRHAYIGLVTWKGVISISCSHMLNALLVVYIYIYIYRKMMWTMLMRSKLAPWNYVKIYWES